MSPPRYMSWYSYQAPATVFLPPLPRLEGWNPVSSAPSTTSLQAERDGALRRGKCRKGSGRYLCVKKHRCDAKPCTAGSAPLPQLNVEECCDWTGQKGAYSTWNQTMQSPLISPSAARSRRRLEAQTRSATRAGRDWPQSISANYVLIVGITRIWMI